MAQAPPAISPFEYCFRVPHDHRAVRVARASLRAVLTAHDVPELIDRAELLASEMLTNALVHSDGEADLRLRWAWETLRMTVWDTSPKPPGFLEISEDSEDSESGRGLYLLQILADRWNHFPLSTAPFGARTKVVWCEIGRTPPPAW